MKKWLIIGLLASVSFSLLFIAFVGINPRAQKVINPSLYQNLPHVGYSVYQRLSQDINKSSVIILGLTDKLSEAEEVWTGFFLAEEKYKPQNWELISYKNLKPIKGKFVETNAIDSEQEVIDSVKRLLGDKKKIVIATSSEESSYFDKNSLAQKLVKELKMRPLTITQDKFYLSKEESAEVVCDDMAEKNSLTCKSLEASKKYFRKKFSPEDLRVIMEKHGPNDYLLLIHPKN